MDKKCQTKYKIGRGSVYNINYHFVWTPKRRKAVLIGQIASDTKHIIEQLATDLKIKIESLSIQSDHIHLFVSCPPTWAPHQIVKNMKGATSKKLREKYPQLSKIPCLWSASYYCGSVGHVSESVVKLYIENQKGR